MPTTPPLAEKIAFLGRAKSYPFAVEDIVRRETHMSWVFLVGERVYKLKKPVRLPYLDFSTLARRERACRAELRLNRRLAPDVYLELTPLRAIGDQLSLGGAGTTVDWLVVMRRLDEHDSLEQTIVDHRLRPAQIDRLIRLLVCFYRQAPVRAGSPRRHLSAWRRHIGDNTHLLLRPELALPAGLIRSTAQSLYRFLDRHGGVVMDRVRQGRIVDGHGDLRPEHVWLDGRIRIIDCLEFDACLRAIDPIDEIAFLGLECERLGASWVAEQLRQGVQRGLRDRPPEALFRFYRCYRAMLRARLAAAHLLEPDPRTPGKWRGLARTYLALASADARRLQTLLRKPEDR